MIKKLYRKLYFYTIVVLIATIFLTATTINLITRRDFKERFEEHMSRQLIPLKLVIKEIAGNNAVKLNEIISGVERESNWKISFWKDFDCISNCNAEHISIKGSREFQILITEKRTQELRRENSGPVVMSYLDKLKPAEGFIIVSFNDFLAPPPRIIPILLNTILVLFFLMILLIPYTKFVLKPFNELMLAINSISAGNFYTLIKVNKKSEFKEIAEAFNNMTIKIQDMINQKQRLISGVSHELRTPLSKIRLGLELLLKEGKGNLKYIDRSILETELLDKLINELLDISELDLESGNYRLTKTDFKEIVEQNIEKNSIVFKEKGLKLKKYFPEQGIFVKVDRMLMDRVFNSIFSNVIKYASQNSDVDLSLKIENNKALLMVRNYGSSVSPEYYEKIFEPFYRTDESRSRETGGMGLGLSTVKKIIEFHGGKVWANTPSDNKTGFVLNLEISLCK